MPTDRYEPLDELDQRNATSYLVGVVLQMGKAPSTDVYTTQSSAEYWTGAEAVTNFDRHGGKTLGLIA